MVDALRGELPLWANASLLPNSGALLATVCYLSAFLLQLIPGWNRPRRGQQDEAPAAEMRGNQHERAASGLPWSEPDRRLGRSPLTVRR